MECFKCHAHSPNGSNFCNQCGEPFPKSNPVVSATAVKYKPIHTWPHAESLDAFVELKDSRSKLNLIALLGSISLFILGSLFIWNGVGILISLVILIFINVATYRSELSATEYYSLPYSKVEGTHRCIFCGGRGIYTHGKYKSNTKTSDCSGCKATLFTN